MKKIVKFAIDQIRQQWNLSPKTVYLILNLILNKYNSWIHLTWHKGSYRTDCKVTFFSTQDSNRCRPIGYTVEILSSTMDSSP